jgi:hypothetical protein
MLTYSFIYFFDVIHLLKPAKIVFFLVCLVLAFLQITLILCKNFLRGFFCRIAFEINLFLVQSFKKYSAKGERLNNRTEFGQIKLSVFDVESFG